MVDLSVVRMVPQSFLRMIGTGAAFAGVTSLLKAGALSLTSSAATATTGAASTAAAAGGTLVGVIGAATTVGAITLIGSIGYKAIKNHHERILMIMNNIIGRDSLEILPLTYRNLPYVAGVEGIKKDSYMRHMYGQVLSEDGKVNIFERMGYMNAPMEFEFYTKIAKDSPVWAFLQSATLPFSQGTGGLYDTGGSLKEGITGP